MPDPIRSRAATAARICIHVGCVNCDGIDDGAVVAGAAKLQKPSITGTGFQACGKKNNSALCCQRGNFSPQLL